jgi:DNA-binding transcriptional regulator YhcF (GntR family)
VGLNRTWEHPVIVSLIAASPPRPKNRKNFPTLAWQEIADIVSELILSKQICGYLPSIRQVEEATGAKRMAVDRAWKELEAQGLITGSAGRNFVIVAPNDHHPERISDRLDDIIGSLITLLPEIRGIENYYETRIKELMEENAQLKAAR